VCPFVDPRAGENIAAAEAGACLKVTGGLFHIRPLVVHKAPGQILAEIGMRLQGEYLSAFRGERLVLRDVCFTVPSSGALLLLGPNGAGKSTLLRVLAGLKRPDAGRLLWDGSDALADPALHATQIAFLGHLDAVKPGLTVAENLALPARLSGRPIGMALEAVGLAALAELPARMLSAGQRRRLAIARLVLSRAPLWLLDEPTLGLDARSVELFGALLARHREAGGVVVAATHLPLPLPGAETLQLGPLPAGAELAA
jgi:heme exporter protein A